MTGFVTSPTETTHSDADQAEADQQGYHLCEFCEASGEPCSNPESVCECSPITRRVAGPRPVTDRYDTILRLAETAVIRHWSPDWNHDVTVTDSIVRGQCGDEYTVKITFDGLLTLNLDDEYETAAGTTRIRSMSSDGTVSIGVTLAADRSDSVGTTPADDDTRQRA